MKSKPKPIRTFFAESCLDFFDKKELEDVAAPYQLVEDEDDPQLLATGFYSRSVFYPSLESYLKKDCIKLFVSCESFVRFQPGKPVVSTVESSLIFRLEDEFRRRLRLPRFLGHWLLKKVVQWRKLLRPRLLFYSGFVAREHSKCFRYMAECGEKKFIVMPGRPTCPDKTIDLPYFIPVKRRAERVLGKPVDELYSFSDEELLNRKFCCLVISNSFSLPRLDFAFQLSKYKKVHIYGGSLLANKTSPVVKKHWTHLHELYKDYKFVINFENFAAESYISEKLLLGLMGHSLPIYHGARNIGDYFNKKRFLTYTHWEPFIHPEYRVPMSETVKKVIALDKDNEAYLNMVKQPMFTPENEQFIQQKWENYAKFIQKVLKEASKVS